MTSPSGEQFDIAGGGYRAVVTESGGALRALEYDGVELVDGFGFEESSPGGRGQLLMPWPNRLRDGHYSFEGRELQLALTEPKFHNASHGLVRWATFQRIAHTASAVTLGCRVLAQTGYPWCLDVMVEYSLSAEGLAVTQSIVNLSDSPAPVAAGAHPYLTVGAPVDECELQFEAAYRLLLDDRLLPVGEEPVTGTERDFQAPRLVGGLALNDAFGGLGTPRAVLRHPETGRAVEIRGDENVRWWLVYSGDDGPVRQRQSLAIEPMSAPPDAFNSGRDLVALAPGATFSLRWGLGVPAAP